MPIKRLSVAIKIYEEMVMRIEIRLDELPEIVSSLNNFVKVPIPAKYAYRLQKIVRTLRGELEDLKKHHEDLVRKYGTESEDRKSIHVDPENIPAYSQEAKELFSETTAVDFEKMPLSLIGGGLISTHDMNWLERFFDDDLSPVIEIPQTE